MQREKAAELGFTGRDIANSVLLSLSGSGQVQPGYWLNPKVGIQYLVNVRAPEHVMNSVESLEGIPVISARGATNEQLLANLATIHRSTGPAVISHYNAVPVIDVFGGVSGRDLGGVMREILPLIEQARKELPRGSSITIRGVAETMRSSYQGLFVGLVVAAILIYLLLVVNFQDWVEPLIIISALPAALSGVIWALWVTQTPLSVPALMGAIMCLGVGTANSVLVISFARTLRQAGTPADMAALQAGTTRFRAVLMTAWP